MLAKVTYVSCCHSSVNALDDLYMLLIQKIHNNIIKTRKRYVETTPVTPASGLD